jgi:hypothetical protein
LLQGSTISSLIDVSLVGLLNLLQQSSPLYRIGLPPLTHTNTSHGVIKSLGLIFFIPFFIYLMDLLIGSPPLHAAATVRQFACLAISSNLVVA